MILCRKNRLGIYEERKGKERKEKMKVVRFGGEVVERGSYVVRSKRARRMLFLQLARKLEANDTVAPLHLAIGSSSGMYARNLKH